VATGGDGIGIRIGIGDGTAWESVFGIGIRDGDGSGSDLELVMEDTERGVWWSMRCAHARRVQRRKERFYVWSGVGLSAGGTFHA